MSNKAQFIDALAERLDGDRKRAAAALDAVIDTVYAMVAKGERVALTGFGVFEKRERKARTARNPATGATVKVKKTSVPAFRAGAEFKAITSGARKLAKAPAKTATKVAADARKAAGKVAAKATGSAPAKKAPAKKAPAKKSPASGGAPRGAKKAPAKKAPAKKASR